MSKRVSLAALCLCLLSAPCFATSGLPPGSVTVWDRIMKEQSFINLRKGYMLMGSEKYAEAANEFLKAISENPKEPYAHILYGSSLYWLGEPDRAMDEFNAAAGLDPQNAVAYQLMGIVHAWKGELPAALEKFKKAEELANFKSDVKMNIGSIYNSLGDRGRALSYFREAVRLEPENPLYRFQLGLLYSRLGRCAEAKNSFKKAISKFRDYEDAMLELAVLEEKDGKVKEALSLYKKALELKPGDNVARFRLACLFYKTGNNDGLKKLLNEAFLLTPSNDRGGISISLSYAGAPDSGKTPDGRRSDKPASLENAIKKIPADEDINIQAEIISVPKTPVVMPSGEGPAGLRSGLERIFSRRQVSYLKREYSLPASDFRNRADRAARIAAEIDAAVKAAGKENDTRMSLSIETKKASGTSAASVSGRNAKVVFKPRDVGNDMGLWVMGDNWLENVEEALDELSLSRAAGPRSSGGFSALTGLGRLILGEPDAALEEFQKTGPELGAAGELGSCAAWVEKGSEEKALAACLEALKKEPSNKTALANKKWLERAADAD
ncbi:MAG: tetratricopeptide repeat protein [Elusimicrobia bacterium]|nr:tetratricopeptide repeat protein [Elusimicrobiota bacterium]